jgi:hypothetical protein
MSKNKKKKSLLTEGEMLRWKELTGQKDAYDPDFWLNEGDYKKEKMKETPPQDMKQKYLEEEEEIEEGKKGKKKPGKVDHAHPDHKLKTVKEGEDMKELDEMGYKRDEEPMMEEDDDDLEDMGGDDMPPMDDAPEMDDMGGDDMPPMDDAPEMDDMGGAPSVEQALQDLVAALKSELAAGEDIETTVVDDGEPEMDDVPEMDDAPEMDDMGGDDMPPMDDEEEEALAEKIEEMLNRHEKRLAEKVAKRLKKK